MFVITNNVLLIIVIIIIIPPTLNAWLTTYHHHQTSINRPPSHSPSFKQHNINNDNNVNSNCQSAYRKKTIQFLQSNDDDRIAENDDIDDYLVDLMKNPSTSSRRDTFGAMLGSILLPASFTSESANAASDDEFSYKVSKYFMLLSIFALFCLQMKPTPIFFKTCS